MNICNEYYWNILSIYKEHTSHFVLPEVFQGFFNVIKLNRNIVTYTKDNNEKCALFLPVVLFHNVLVC